MCISDYEKINWKCDFFTNADKVLDTVEMISKRPERWGYRGQPGIYVNLQPSIERVFRDVLFASHQEEREVKLRFESQSVELFRRTIFSYSDYFNERENFDYVRSLGLLQHYEGVTRLLDWSFSPYTALYFAVSSNDDEGGEIWSFNYDQYERKAPLQWDLYPKMKTNDWINAFDKESTDDWFVCEFLGDKFPRLYAQDGFFTMTSQFGIDHAQKIAKLFEDQTKFHVYAFDKCCKFRLRRYLCEKLHIWHGSIYPDITGVGAGIKEVLTDQAKSMSYSGMHKYFSCFFHLINKNQHKLLPKEIKTGKQDK